MSTRDIKTVNSVADAYRSMYAEPIQIDEDILNEELIDALIEEVREEETVLSEAMSKQMTVQQYANKIGIDAKEKQWIIDNEPDAVAYFPNDKLKGAWNALSYPVRTGDYYFAFLTGDDDKRVKAASDANMKMNDLLKSEFAKAKKLKFDGEPYNEYMIASHLWNFLYPKFEKLPRNLGAGDTMVREELYKAIEDLVGEAPQFESYDHEGETIQEGMVSGMLGKILNKVRNARKKIGKKIKLGRKAVIKAQVQERAGGTHAYDDPLDNLETSIGMTSFDRMPDKNKKAYVKLYKKMHGGKEHQALKRKYKNPMDVDEYLMDLVLDKVWPVSQRMKGIGHKGMKKGGIRAQVESSKYDANILKSVADTYASMQKYGIQGDIVEQVEETQLDEVQKVEVDSMKKVSKQMQAVLKAYQGVVNKGDKELKDTKHNATYKKVLDARDSILTMIGTLQTKMLMQKENLDERVSGDDTPMSMMVHTKDLDVFKKLKVIASKAGVKLAKELKGVKVEGPIKSLIRFTELMDKEPSFKKEEIEFQLNEASAGEMIDKLFNLKGNKDAGYGVAKMLSMTGVKVIQGMQKQNPQGFMKTVIALGKDKGKMQLPTNNALMKMFKQQGIKVEGLEEKVKDGKLDPLSKMGKSKLTGAEINQYYRDNPKQKSAARDKTVKKAIELALDLSGNMNYAMKEIEKLKRGLTKLPAIKLALRHANESKEFTGHHVVIESLSSTNMVKLKTYGSMLAKITKLPFDDKDPEKGIDKLMGQIWQQKHSPANWDKLHKMVGMLNKIGVKMPSLKGKYMGYDPVSKKSIFYKEGTDDIVNWYDKIDEIKEEIEELIEAQEMKDADIKKIAQMTDRNDHNGSLMHLAKLVGNKKAGDALKGIMQTHKALGHMPSGLIDTRTGIYNDLMKQAKSKYSNYNDIYKSF